MRELRDRRWLGEEILFGTNELRELDLNHFSYFLLSGWLTDGLPVLNLGILFR